MYQWKCIMFLPVSLGCQSQLTSQYAWIGLDLRMRGGDSARKQSEFPSVVPRFNLDAVGAWRFLAIVLIM